MSGPAAEIDAWGAEFLSLFTLDELRFRDEDDPVDTATEAPVSFAFEWEDMAKRQRTQRDTAETENEALRRLATAQLQHARSMDRLVARAAYALERVLPPVPSLAGYRGPTEDPYELFRSLEELVAQADEVFAAPTFRRRDLTDLQDAFFRTGDPTASGVELELQMSWALPFDVVAVANAFWQKTTRGSMGGKAMKFQELYEDDDVTVGQFISTPIEEAALPLAHGHVAAQRIARGDSDSRLSVCTGSAYVFDGARVQGVVHTRDWMRFEPIDETMTVSSSVTRVQWCRRLLMHPHAYDRMALAERRKWTLAVVTGPTRHQLARSLQRKIQEAENWLVAHHD